MAKYEIIPSSRTIVQSPISIGHKAEKGVEAIEFDLTAWVETYGPGTLTVIMKRWGDVIPYPIALEIDENNKATWTLSDTDTAKAGMAYAQLSYIVGDEVVKKSDIYTFRVMDSLTGEGEPPEAYDSWLEHLTHLAAEAMAEVLDIEGVATDKTLTVDGGIADAKTTGDALALKADQSTTYTKPEVDALIESVDIETDTTLSVSGKPADAKTVGDELGAINGSLGGLSDTLFYNDEPSVTAFEIVQGGLSNGGANLDGATYKASRRRSSNYVPYAIGSTISCDSAYDMAIYFYTGATVSSYDSNTGYIGNTYVIPYVTNAKYVRLVMKRVDGQNFADENIPVVTYTKLISRLDDAEGSINSIMSNASIMRSNDKNNLNDYTTTGAIILGYLNEFVNSPNNTHGQRLLVVYSRSHVTFQLFINKSTLEYYIRQYSGGAWSEWTDMTSGISFDVDAELDEDSTNPVQNKAITAEINNIKATKYNESQNMDVYDSTYSQSALSSNITKDVVRVMSYNVAQYNNDGAVHIGDANKKDTLIHFKQMLMHVNADIVCTQEDAEYIDSNDTLAPLPCLFAPLYPYKLGVGGPALYYRKAGTVKNYTLSNVTVRRGIVEVGKKQLYVYTAHFSVSSVANRQTQINDILTNAIGVDNPTHWVLCGDFNSIEAEDRSYLVNLANTNSYTLANGGYLGWINTNKVNLPLDNMLCSPKVAIMRFEVLGNWFADLWSDHYPIYCDLALLD